MHLYPENSTKNQFRKGSCEYHCLQTEPGLDKFVGNASGVEASPESIIDWSEQWVPNAIHRETPVFVLAIVGLQWVGKVDTEGFTGCRVCSAGSRICAQEKLDKCVEWRKEAYYGWVALVYQWAD